MIALLSVKTSSKLIRLKHERSTKEEKVPIIVNYWFSLHISLIVKDKICLLFGQWCVNVNFQLLFSYLPYLALPYIDIENIKRLKTCETIYRYDQLPKGVAKT